MSYAYSWGLEREETMNKYQEALDNLVKNSCPKRKSCKECETNAICNSIAKGNIDTLQELIDLHEPKEIKVGQVWECEVPVCIAGEYEMVTIPRNEIFNITEIVDEGTVKGMCTNWDYLEKCFILIDLLQACFKLVKDVE